MAQETITDQMDKEDWIDYDDTLFETPATEEEQRRYTIPLIRDLGTSGEVAGNINVRELLEGFGAELLAENTIAEENISKMTELADAASTSASNASKSATAAADSASEASGSATAAAQSLSDANNAKENAVTAKDAAVTAQGAAEQARDDCQELANAFTIFDSSYEAL